MRERASPWVYRIEGARICHLSLGVSRGRTRAGRSGGERRDVSVLKDYTASIVHSTGPRPASDELVVALGSVEVELPRLVHRLQTKAAGAGRQG
eukprot:scaffold111922_cov48-Phaeocystis_antarctica.AAC.1